MTAVLSLLDRAYWSTRPGHQPKPTVPARLATGAWEGAEYVQCGLFHIVGVEVDGDGVLLTATCGVHDDVPALEPAMLSPRDARAIARALYRAARLADGGDGVPVHGQTEPSPGLTPENINDSEHLKARA